MDKTVESLKTIAIAISEPIKFVTGSINGKEEEYSPEKSLNFNGCYTINNSIISFVDNDVQYVLPYTEKIEQTLFEEGFEKTENISVPFCHGGYPLKEKEKWEALKKKFNY